MDDVIQYRDRRFDTLTGGSDLLSNWEMLPEAGGEAPVFDQATQDCMDMLRTKIAATMQENNWKTLAITAPTSGCGTTTMAVALAMGLSRYTDMRVALFDLNLRKPGVARLLGLKGTFVVTDFLGGTAPDADHHLVRKGTNLAIAPNTILVADPAPILHAAPASAAMALMQTQLAPDYVILDLPPMLEHDDLLGVLPMVDCVLLVLGAERSSLGEADACERELSGRGKLLGVVLNRCRIGLRDIDVGIGRAT